MLIGICGFAGSGKGTIADILVTKNNFTKLSFADTLKDATAAIFGWDRHLLEGETKESREFREKKDEWWSERFGFDFSPRLALQLMGTEAGRNSFHSDIWIYSLEKKLSDHSNVVIPDVRFPNEIDFINKKGGFIVRVKRGVDPEWYDTALTANKSGTNKMFENYSHVHYSEWAWIGHHFNYELYNEGAISMLERDIEHMLKVFSGPIDLDFFNKITKDGMPKKTLNIALAGTDVGKSLFMRHVAASK